MGSFIAGLILVGFLVLLAAFLARLLLSAVGLGSWACRKGWHWYRDFPLHTRQGLTGRTTTYLAVAGVKIHQCRTCGQFSPAEGQAVYGHWKGGGIAVSGGGIFTGPTVKANREAARAIGATLAASVAAAPPRKPKPPPERWKVVVGSWPVVQVLGKYVMIVTLFGAMFCLVATLSAKSGGEVVEMLMWAAGLGAFTWFLTGLIDAGMSRYISQKLAAESARDPVAAFKRAAEIAAEHGLEVPADLTPEEFAERQRRRAERE